MMKILVVGALTTMATVSCAPVYYSDVVVEPEPKVIYTPASSVNVVTKTYSYGRYRDRHYDVYQSYPSDGKYYYRQYYYY